MSRVRGPRLWWRALLVLGVAAVLAGGTATVASAHDALVGTSPADGSTVGAVPGQVTLTFDQPALALGSTVLVAGPGGPVMSGRTRVTDKRVTQAVQPGAPAGRYTVTWRVTSIDGHPVSGSFGFTATAAAPGTRPQVAPSTAGAGAQAPTADSGVAWWVYGVGAAVVAAVAAAALTRRRRVG
jgi:methionine-rich copper-binding protein CopC